MEICVFSAAPLSFLVSSFLLLLSLLIYLFALLMYLLSIFINERVEVLSLPKDTYHKYSMLIGGRISPLEGRGGFMDNKLIQFKVECTLKPTNHPVRGDCGAIVLRLLQIDPIGSISLCMARISVKSSRKG